VTRKALTEEAYDRAKMVKFIDVGHSRGIMGGK
jgi:hypothetical protein